MRFDSDTERSHPVVLIAAYAACTAATIIPVGPIDLLAVIGAIALPVTLRRTRIGRDRSRRAVAAVFLSWLLVCLASALVHPTAAVSTLGQLIYPAAILVVMLLTVRVLNAGVGPAACVVFGVGLGVMIGASQVTLQGNSPLLWVKSGYGQGATMCVFATVSWLGSRRLVSVGAALLSGIALFLLDFRSLGLICVLTAMLLLLLARPAVTARRFFICIVLVIAAIPGVSAAFSAAESAGLFGAQAATRFDDQSDSDSGLLLAARPELNVASVAISSHPWLGRGAQVPLTLGEQRAVYDELLRGGLSVAPIHLQRLLNGVVTHSLALQSWVSNGVAGTIPILLLLVALWFLAWRGVRTVSPTREVSLFGACLFSWDSFLSPWNLHYEAWFGVLLAVGLATKGALSTAVQDTARVTTGSGGSSATWAVPGNPEQSPT